MKSLFTSLVILGLLMSCQQSNKSKTIPQATIAATPRVKYRLVFIKQERKHEYNDELYFRDFETKVSQLIAEGWQPLGGVSIVAMGYPVQTMIKTE